MAKTNVRETIINFLREKPQLIILALAILILSITTPKFATSANLMNILKQVSVIAIISCGLTLVVVSGSLDLSVGSVLSLLTSVSALIQLKNDALAVVVPIVLSVAIGLFNGFIISKFKVNSIIVTLGSLSVFGGLALMLTNGAIIIGRTGTWYSDIAQGKFLTVPYHVIIIMSPSVKTVFQKTISGIRLLIYAACKFTGLVLNA